jgi:hypothetical protein
VALDVGRLTRLKAAIDSTASMKAGVSSAAALTSAARQYRTQVADTLDGDLKAEFEAMFPVDTRPIPSAGNRGGGDILKQASRAEEALAVLLGISGWLAGLVNTGDK